MSNDINSASTPAIRVLFVNNGGEGYANWISIPEGTTIATFFATQIGDRQIPANYMKRIRRAEVTFGGPENPIEAGFVLQNGDRISITPTKVEGAC